MLKWGGAPFEVCFGLRKRQTSDLMLFCESYDPHTVCNAGERMTRSAMCF